VTGEGAENGLQRTVKLRFVAELLRRSEMVKSELHSRNGKQAKSE
jgi:hypothetical protein